MKILQLLTNIDQTGMATNCIDLCKELSNKGHEVILLVGHPYKIEPKLAHLYNLVKNSNIKVIYYNIKFRGNTFNKIRTLIELLIKILWINPDIIHCQSPYLSFIPWLLKKKFISTLHIANLIRCFEYKNATIIIAISQETYTYAIDTFDYKPNELALVYHGVSPRFMMPISESENINLKTKLGIPLNDIVIGIVASIEHRKGHDVLLNALQLLDSSYMNKISVLFVGSYKSGASSKWIENLIEKSDFKSKIFWQEYQDPKPFYDIMDIFVLPSRLEGFPLVTLEAFLSGCCVVRSNVQGAYDQVKNQETGFLFENENSHELKNILQKLLDDDIYRKKIALNGKNYANENFTASVMANNTLKVYNKIIRNNG